MTNLIRIEVDKIKWFNNLHRWWQLSSKPCRKPNQIGNDSGMIPPGKNILGTKNLPNEGRELTTTKENTWEADPFPNTLID